jgi:hypothetical protein
MNTVNIVICLVNFTLPHLDPFSQLLYHGPAGPTIDLVDDAFANPHHPGTRVDTLLPRVRVPRTTECNFFSCFKYVPIGHSFAFPLFLHQFVISHFFFDIFASTFITE